MEERILLRILETLVIIAIHVIILAMNKINRTADMDETVSDHSIAELLPKSDQVTETIELSTSQEITALKSNYKAYNDNNKEKSWNYKSPDGTIKCCCCTISPKVAKYLEISALIISVVIVLMLLSTPIITHIVDKVRRYHLSSLL